MTLEEFKERKVLPSILEYADNVKKDNEAFNKPRGRQQQKKRKKGHGGGRFTSGNRNDNQFGTSLRDMLEKFNK